MRIKTVSLLLLFLPLLNWTAQAQTIPSHPPRPVTYDFDGNGMSDLVWRNKKTGEVAIWLLNGSNEPQRTFRFASVDLQWQIAGVGDLDGDGKADLIWRNTQSGDVAEWLMDGTTVKSWATISSVPDQTWQIAAIGDLDGDGKADLIWRNTQLGDVAEWLMDTATVKSWATIVSGLDRAWQIEGVGDLDGDGKADLVWRSTESGDVGKWLMDGATVKSWATIVSGLDRAWQIEGVGDLDGDGKADLVWRSTESGDLTTWLMNGGTVKVWSTSYLDADEDLLWQIVAVNDLDGDGKADLMWRNAQTGRMWKSLLDGASVKVQGTFNADPAWDKSFSPIQVSHLEVSQFVVTSYLWRGRYNYYPRLRLTETGGKTGISVTNFSFHLNGIGVQGNVPPWKTGKRINAGTSREMNVLDGYGDPELELSSTFSVASVSVTISFTDDLGASGYVTVSTDVSPADAGAWQIQ